jgi:hypothetical protein
MISYPPLNNSHTFAPHITCSRHLYSFFKITWYNTPMFDEKYIREELIFHLEKGHAHMTVAEAVADFPVSHMNTVFTNGEYTFWHLLEHIRRTQSDILEFIVDPQYKDKKWPDDYWPEKDKKAKKTDWDATISAFFSDLEKLKKLVEDPKTDLTKKFTHGTGQTLMREIIVVTDHNAYHIGEFAIMRQVLGAWDKNHK